MDKIRIALADDHSLVRDGIKSLLEEFEEIEVIAEASDGREALEIIESDTPDILIVDIRMPVLNGIETVSRMTENNSSTRALVLSMHDSDEYVLQSIEAGANGYLLKDTSKEEFVKAIHTVHQGGQYFSGDISPILVKKYLENVKQKTTTLNSAGATETNTEGIHLTRRQKQILDLVVSGKSNKEIAEELGKSVRTIEAHRFSLMKKMQVKNQIELSNKARELGLIS